MTTRPSPAPSRVVAATVVALLAVILVFFGLRLVTDVPFLAAGTAPPERAFESRYVAHPVPAYVHIVPGVVFLLGALLQFSARWRRGHLPGHRRLGRVLVVCGLVSGVLAVVVGLWFPYGGPLEAGAAAVFGVAFVAELVVAVRAVRRGDVLAHRRWMCRAFALALGVGTIRVWIGVFQLAGVLSIAQARGTVFFGAAFWLALVLHAVEAEVYLRLRPRPPRGVATSTT